MEKPQGVVHPGPARYFTGHEKDFIQKYDSKNKIV
jgi:hypothetical protein